MARVIAVRRGVRRPATWTARSPSAAMRRLMRGEGMVVGGYGTSLECGSNYLSSMRPRMLSISSAESF